MKAALALAILACVGYTEAAVVGRFVSGDEEVALHDVPHGTSIKDCPESSKRVEWSKGPRRVGGCYIVHEDKAYMLYEDGDVGVAPMAAFKLTGL